MQFKGGYRYPGNKICALLTIFGIILTTVIVYLKSLPLEQGVIIFFSLEGTVLLASALSPVGLVPPQGNFFKKVKWLFEQQGGVPLSYNQPMYYGGLLCIVFSIALNSILSDVKQIEINRTGISILISAIFGGTVATGINVLLANKREKKEYHYFMVAFLAEFISSFERCITYWDQAKNKNETSYSTLYTFIDSSAFSKLISVCGKDNISSAIIEIKSCFFQIERHTSKASGYALEKQYFENNESIIKEEINNGSISEDEGNKKLAENTKQKIKYSLLAVQSQGVAISFLQSSYEKIVNNISFLLKTTKENFSGKTIDRIEKSFLENKERKNNLNL